MFPTVSGSAYLVSKQWYFWGDFGKQRWGLAGGCRSLECSRIIHLLLNDMRLCVAILFSLVASPETWNQPTMADTSETRSQTKSPSLELFSLVFCHRMRSLVYIRIAWVLWGTEYTLKGTFTILWLTQYGWSSPTVMSHTKEMGDLVAACSMRLGAPAIISCCWRSGASWGPTGLQLTLEVQRSWFSYWQRNQ